MRIRTKTSTSRRFHSFLAAIAFSLALPGASMAQDDDTIVHDFSDADLVTGHLQSSDLALINIRHGLRHTSLIRPRLTFVPELLKSCENN